MTQRETDLYAPVKAFLETQGYIVKGEVGAVDVVGCRGTEPPVLVELKLTFSLGLVHQGIARQGMADAVYLAVPTKSGRTHQRAMKDNLSLCRRLGLGLITVRLRDGLVNVLCDPGPYRPRQNAQRLGRLLREFARLEGDPNMGGGTRVGLVTAYRQDALKCAAHLKTVGASKGSEVAKETGVPRATRIMADNHYGWFERVEPGIYMLSPKGQQLQV